MNGVNTLSDEQLSLLNNLAQENGLAPLSNQKNDLPHFSADPTKFGYKNLKDAVDENKADYNDRYKNINLHQ